MGRAAPGRVGWRVSFHKPAVFRGYPAPMFRQSLALALCCALGLALAPAASAQPRAPAPQAPLTQPGQQAPQRQSREAWRQGQLTELASVLGGAHYLRILCQGRGDQRWRDFMLGVISHEPGTRALMVENFNRGYRDQEARYQECDQEATQSEAELRARGLRISHFKDGSSAA